MFCDSCGEEITPQAKFCTGCGTDLSNHSLYSPPQSYGQQTSKYIQQPQYGYSPNYQSYYNTRVPQRNYFSFAAWSLLGVIGFFVGLTYLVIRGPLGLGFFLIMLVLSFLLIFVGGIAMLVYYYNNASDYQNMIYRYHPNTYPQPQEPILMLVLLFVFWPLFSYFKYQQLHNHFKEHHPDLQPSRSAWDFYGFVGWPLIFVLIANITVTTAAISTIVTFLPVISFITFYYMEYRWQETLNRHIDYHGSHISQY